MALSKKQVQGVARLARLGLTDDQIDIFSKDLDSILEMVAELSELNVEKIKETSHVTGLTNVTRPDTPQPSLPRDVFLKGAPAHDRDQLKVKGIFN